MSEWILILYPVLLLAYLMLAARWQPKHEPSWSDEHHRRQSHHGRGLRDD
ncbi:MAG TPA: hypothetical protein VFP48_10790 [Steroidobacteraceae bacterium]|nr:hypothetical protein [Steroidobacteraceae bacterium]